MSYRIRIFRLGGTETVQVIQEEINERPRQQSLPALRVERTMPDQITKSEGWVEANMSPL